MLIRSAHSTPPVGSWRRMLTLVEGGLPHPATLLQATPDTLAIQIASPGQPGRHHIRPGDGAMRCSALVAAGLLAGCAGNANLPKPDNAVRGHVTYLERMALPADAEVAVQLFDVSRQDTAATPVADTTIRPDGRQVPLPFVLRFDPKRIDPRHDYAVGATITSEGRPAFTTTTTVKVITRDHPTMVDLVLSRTDEKASGQ
jgi:putative lipoprotein